MKISVVVPAYNEEELLPHLLKSIQKQDFPKDKVEVIVVDNNSTDSTPEIAKKYGARVVKEKKQGITYARNTGTLFATGAIIVTTDADCILPPQYFAKITKIFESSEKIAMVCTLGEMPDAPLVGRLSLKVLHGIGKLYYTKLNQIPYFLCWAHVLSYKRNMFEKLGRYELNSPLLEKGINSGGTDDIGFVKRFEKAKTEVVFDFDLVVSSSGRRLKDRLLYWFFIEHLLGYFVNDKLYKRFGVVVPVPAYHKRVMPGKGYKTMYNNFLKSITNEVIKPTQKIVPPLRIKQTKKELQKALLLREDIMDYYRKVYAKQRSQLRRFLDR